MFNSYIWFVLKTQTFKWILIAFFALCYKIDVTISNDCVEIVYADVLVVVIYMVHFKS
jgi:hypothetical protein